MERKQERSRRSSTFSSDINRKSTAPRRDQTHDPLDYQAWALPLCYSRFLHRQPFQLYNNLNKVNHHRQNLIIKNRWWIGAEWRKSLFFQDQTGDFWDELQTISKRVFSALLFVFVDVAIAVVAVVAVAAVVVVAVVAVVVVAVFAVVVVGFFVFLSANKSEIRFKGGAAAAASQDCHTVQRRRREEKTSWRNFKPD